MDKVDIMQGDELAIRFYRFDAEIDAIATTAAMHTSLSRQQLAEVLEEYIDALIKANPPCRLNEPRSDAR